jgi:hypothetical protein
MHKSVSWHPATLSLRMTVWTLVWARRQDIDARQEPCNGLHRKGVRMWLGMLMLGVACFAVLAAFTWACDRL